MPFRDESLVGLVFALHSQRDTSPEIQYKYLVRQLRILALQRHPWTRCMIEERRMPGNTRKPSGETTVGLWLPTPQKRYESYGNCQPMGGLLPTTLRTTNKTRPWDTRQQMDRSLLGRTYSAITANAIIARTKVHGVPTCQCSASALLSRQKGCLAAMMRPQPVAKSQAPHNVAVRLVSFW